MRTAALLLPLALAASFTSTPLMAAPATPAPATATKSQLYLQTFHPGPQALFSHMGKDASEEFEMLHDDEVIPKYAAGIVIGRVKGQEITLEY